MQQAENKCGYPYGYMYIFRAGYNNPLQGSPEKQFFAESCHYTYYKNSKDQSGDRVDIQERVGY